MPNYSSKILYICAIKFAHQFLGLQLKIRVEGDVALAPRAKSVEPKKMLFFRTDALTSFEKVEIERSWS